MGFLKGVRDLKGVSDHHGGMPSIRQSFKDIGAVMDDRGEREIMKNGTPTKAVAKGFPEPVPGDRFAMQILLEVHPADGGAPYDVQYVFPATRMKAALSVGMELPVKVDPADPQRIAVQWDAQQASIAAAGGDMAAVTGGMQQAYGNVADQAMRDAQAKSAADDPTAKLKKLTEMKDAGLITSEEFDAKKKDLLADL
jgi:hypothetical protein